MRFPLLCRTLPCLAAALLLAGCSAFSVRNSHDDVVISEFDYGLCDPTPAPQGGSTNCHASLGLYVNMTVSSGWVSIRMDYPQPGSTYVGDGQTDQGPPGYVFVPLVNPYVPKCVDSYQTTVAVYDGRTSDPNRRLLKEVPFTLRNTC